MPERARPALYTIPAHRAFADALAIGLLARHGRDPLELARGIILVPNARAGRSIADAFVRHADSGGGRGLLLPRLVPIGDPELDERLGGLFDPADAPAGGEADIPPAIQPLARQMILARLVQDARAGAGQPVDAGEAMRLALALAAALDQMLIEEVPPRALRDLPVRAELQGHWRRSLEMFELLVDAWPAELARHGVIDLADRRGRLLHAAARRWRNAPPPGFVVAAGISTPAPAVAALLKTVSRLPRGQVVLADLDQHMSAAEWHAIGPFDPDPVTGRRPRAHETHPQFALKLLLDRMDVGRDEVALWRWGSEHDAGATRSRNISNAMLPPMETLKWRDLKTADRSLAGVRALEAATPAEEAQAVALALREALETPGRTAALVTPDRQFAARVSAHLRRWGVEADDSAGRPLSDLPPGTLILSLAVAAAERFAPVALLSLLKHPLVRQGEARLAWLDSVRALDLALRGPRPAPGLAGVAALLADRAPLARWWREEVMPLLASAAAAFTVERANLADLLAALREGASALSGDAVWAGYQGHQASALFAEMEGAAALGPGALDPRELPAMLDHVLAAQAVRPPQGGHPRLSIWGLIESRLQQADLMILAGLNEGNWPPLPAPDPWLAPRVRQELGLPGLERRIGLAAHDLANGLGAPQVLITRSRRDASAPAVASRFWLRLQAMAGRQWRPETRLPALARMLDRPDRTAPVDRPHPAPPAELRPKAISVTEVDRLKADPYAFYARRVLGLSRLDPVDADPSAAWRGTAIHEILEAWSREDGHDPARLLDRAKTFLDAAEAHPLMRTLWRPRLMAALEWVTEALAEDRAGGREVRLAEAKGKAVIAGVELTGKVDRIDRLATGGLAVIDYKTGKPPSGKQVAAGYSMQLGLLGMIAEAGGFDGLPAGVRAEAFEYWSLQKRPRERAFGYRASPVDAAGARGRLRTDAFVDFSRDVFADAAGRWLTGDAPFTAKLVPDLALFDEYDQLMRLEEWYGRGDGHG